MDPKVQFDAALRQLRAGNAGKAAELCTSSLEAFPGDANFLVLSARSHIALRDFDAAQPAVEEAVRLYPDFALAHETLGDLLLVQGKLSRALTAYRTAVRLDPANQPVRDKIERTREMEKGGVARSVDPSGRRVIAFEDEIAKAQQHQADGDLRAAEMIYRDILTRDPEHVEAARLLAIIANKQKHHRDAEIFLQRVVKNAPNHTAAWVELVNAQRELHKLEEALESAAKVIELAPDSAESYMVYASAIGVNGDHDAAIRAYEKALSIDPKRAGALTSMAHHQKTIGLQDVAIATYRKAIEIEPDNAEAYWSLANLKTFRFSESEIAAMHELLEKPDLSDASRAQANNALGLEYEAQGDYDRAFKHFAQCNAARRPHESYDPVETEESYGKIIELFTPSFFESAEGPGDSEVTPIFVVGLPRSGSTLIEQILASHSQVEGTHELSELTRAVQSVRRSVERRTQFPAPLEKFGPEHWKAIQDDYIETTLQHRSGAPYFVDKNPNNFLLTGVLKIAIPNAKIIDARRHPLDSCFGSFKQLFASGQPFSYDMTELGEYYLQYDRLMKHFNDVLPGHVHTVHYEEVVADLETEVRKLLDFCGLPFEDACLRFHETERAVKTASSEQVRKPIYSSSVNLWRNYEKHLDELVHILEPLLKHLPGDSRPAALEAEKADLD